MADLRLEGLAATTDVRLLLEQFVQGWGVCDRIRIGVVRTNKQVIPFWTQLGFAATGEPRPYRYASVTSEIVVFEKPLRDAPFPPGASTASSRASLS